MVLIDTRQHLLYIPTDPDELAELLFSCSADWWETLKFLVDYGTKIGVSIDEKAVVSKMKSLYGVEDGQ